MQWKETLRYAKPNETNNERCFPVIPRWNFPFPHWSSCYSCHELIFDIFHWFKTDAVVFISLRNKFSLATSPSDPSHSPQNDENFFSLKKRSIHGSLVASLLQVIPFNVHTHRHPRSPERSKPNVRWLNDWGPQVGGITTLRAKKRCPGCEWCIQINALFEIRSHYKILCNR